MKIKPEYICTCGDVTGFFFHHAERGIACMGCQQSAVPVQAETVMSVLWRGQQEQVVELDRMFAL